MKFQQSAEYLAANNSTAGFRRAASCVLLCAALISAVVTLLNLEVVRGPISALWAGLVSSVSAFGGFVWQGLYHVCRALARDVWLLLIAAAVAQYIVQTFYVIRTRMVLQLAEHYVTTPVAPDRLAQAIDWSLRNGLGLQWAFYGCRALVACAAVAVFYCIGSPFYPVSLVLSLTLVGLCFLCGLCFIHRGGRYQPFCLRSQVVYLAQSSGANCDKSLTDANEWFLTEDGLSWARKVAAAGLLDLTHPEGEAVFARALAQGYGRYAVETRAIARTLAEALRTGNFPNEEKAGQA